MSFDTAAPTPTSSSAHWVFEGLLVTLLVAVGGAAYHWNQQQERVRAATIHPHTHTHAHIRTYIGVHTHAHTPCTHIHALMHGSFAAFLY
jgi:hypothetical protein